MRSEPYVTPESLDTCTAVWLEHVRARSRPRPWLQLRPRRCALVVVDMVRHFAHPEGRSYLPATAAILPQIQALVQAWHDLGAPVVFTRHGHEGPDDTGMIGSFFRDWIRADGPESGLIDALAPLHGDLVFCKSTYDAFLDTPLQGWLQDRAIQQVLICGVLTHMCCETTARSAFCRGLEVYLAADAMATTSEERHLCSLGSLASCVAVVHSSEEVLSRCSTS